MGWLPGGACCCGCARGPYFQSFVLQPLRLKVRKCDAFAASLYAGEGAWRVLLRLFLVCVAMVTTWKGIPVTCTGDYYEAHVKLEFSGSRSDFECLPGIESEIWKLFVESPDEMRAAIGRLKIK